MKKLEIKKLISLLCLTSLFFILVGCSLNPVENYNTSKQKETSSTDHRRYRRLTPEYEVEDFEYIEDGNGIVIDWKVTNKDELGKNNGVEEDFAATSQAFIVRNHMKLRDDFATKDMAEDEYFYLDIFDLRGTRIKKRQVDLWELTQEYLQDDSYGLLGVESGGIHEKNGKFYISVEVKRDKVKKYLFLNLDTLMFEGESSENNHLTVSYNFRSVWAETNEDQVIYLGYDFKKLRDYKGSINLKQTYPSAWKLFNQDDAVAYQLLDLKGKEVMNAPELLDVYSLFLDKGVSIYDVGVIEGRFSNDGQNHRIISYEDVEKYAK